MLFKNMLLWSPNLLKSCNFQLYFLIVLALCITNSLADETRLPTILSSDSSLIGSIFQLEINPGQEYIYTFTVSNTNMMEFSVQMPNKACNGSIFLRMNFEAIPGGNRTANCEAMEFRWEGKDYFVKELNMSNPRFIQYPPGNKTKITYNTTNPVKNIQDEDSFFSFPCKPKFEGGSEGQPYYFTLNVSSTGFNGCIAGIALVGVEEYDPRTTIPSTIRSKITTETPTTKTSTTKISSSTTCKPKVCPKACPESKFRTWLIVVSVIGSVFLIVIVVLIFWLCTCAYKVRDLLISLKILYYDDKINRSEMEKMNKEIAELEEGKKRMMNVAPVNPLDSSSQKVDDQVLESQPENEL